MPASGPPAREGAEIETLDGQVVGKATFSHSLNFQIAFCAAVRTLLVAPGITTRKNKLVGTKGIATRSIIFVPSSSPPHNGCTRATEPMSREVTSGSMSPCLKKNISIGLRLERCTSYFDHKQYRVCFLCNATHIYTCVLDEILEESLGSRLEMYFKASGGDLLL